MTSFHNLLSSLATRPRGLAFQALIFPSWEYFISFTEAPTGVHILEAICRMKLVDMLLITPQLFDCNDCVSVNSCCITRKRPSESFPREAVVNR